MATIEALEILGRLGELYDRQVNDVMAMTEPAAVTLDTFCASCRPNRHPLREHKFPSQQRGICQMASCKCVTFAPWVEETPESV